MRKERREREGGKKEGRGRREGGEREVTMGTMIFTDSSNILQEVCLDQPKQSVLERIEAELTAN